MKDIELRLMIELLKNSHRSDRELARAIRVSQPTITRIKAKLEKEQAIKEYTIIPDYSQLGFTIMSITFTRMKEGLTKEIADDLTKRARNMMSGYPSALILGNTGIGLNADYVTIVLHKDYGEYTKFMSDIRGFPHTNIDETKSFIIDLLGKNQFQPLSFHYIAGYLAKSIMNSQSARATSSPTR